MEGLIDPEKIPPLDINGIEYDSRNVQRGNLFAAIPGMQFDGHDFIPDAIARGAAAVLGSKEQRQLPVPYLRVLAPRATLATLSARFYDEPTKKVPAIGITGTNGKTTSCYLLESILRSAGYHPAVFGTINYRFGDQTFPALHTTPEALDLQRWSAQALAAGADAIVMEVSSHSLTMDRVRECHFDAALFTNLTQDHLDFHGTMEDYYRSKRRLFTEFLPASGKTQKKAILNWEDDYARRLSREIDLPQWRCGWDEGLDYRILACDYASDGTRATIQTPSGTLEITTPLIGSFNLQNSLLAIAAAKWLAIDSQAIQQGLAALSSVPGRLERVICNQEISVFVDYAHTPEALRAVLTTLRSYTKRRLITLFGCGGDRDRGKRPLMGNVAAKLSDVIIVTSDNPRTEDPALIIEQILPGIQAERFPPYRKRGKRGYMIEPDRREAIATAINLAGPGDTVLIAGKGHEDYQIIGTKKVRFDDRVMTQEAFWKRR